MIEQREGFALAEHRLDGFCDPPLALIPQIPLLQAGARLISKLIPIYGKPVSTIEPRYCFYGIIKNWHAQYTLNESLPAEVADL